MPARRQINPQLLRAAREKAGDGTKSAAAAAAKMTWQGYSQWEKQPGRTYFDWNSFRSLCDYLGVKPEDITDEVPETQQAM